MTERIYTRDQQGRLEPLEGERFAKEDELQALIADHPELPDGTQMRPDAPLRWILIAREKGIAESSSAAARWAVDHLLVDNQNAVPTLVEVKRGVEPGDPPHHRRTDARVRGARCADVDGGHAPASIRGVHGRPKSRPPRRASETVGAGRRR